MNVGLSLGSNVGDRLRRLQQARQFLSSISVGQQELASPVYETEPIDCAADAPLFLNAVIEIEFAKTPRALLEQTLAYEREHGRDRSAGHNAPRTIDIDILYFGEIVVHEPGLVIPHPRLVERRFVLLPLSMIRPELVLPGTGKTVATLLRELPGRAEEVRLLQRDW